jgi:phosphatidate phosphatase LPIN
MELLELAGYKSSYIHMSDLVDHFFPPVKVGLGDQEFTDLRYWHLPLAEISDESDDAEGGEGDEDDDDGDDDDGEEGDDDVRVLLYDTDM